MDPTPEQLAMYDASEPVEARLKKILTQDAIDGLADMNDILMAGKEHLGEADPDVLAFEAAIKKFNETCPA